MVVRNDPTLLFTNAGMNPFKAYFLGNAVPKSKRIANTQKCLRVSGKHNDLEEVGKDTYHHTMFEMLGNWSFGDYFKREAIHWAWELLTTHYKIPEDMLYVSVFGGVEEEKLAMDQEAYDLWATLVPKDRIILGNKQDNFWEMGDQGPCGPCAEIHVDIRPADEKSKIPGKSLVNADHPQVVEIWNLVFMQFNRKADGTLEKLPQQHVDTGMGFERLCMVLQKKQSNYDTDVFLPLIQKIEAITNSVYEDSSVPNSQNEATRIAIRVIADHVRAVAFSIADGQLPSNTGAGYVIRRILRRAIRYGFTFLQTKEPFIYLLVPTLCEQMGETFAELPAQQSFIQKVIQEEELAFLRTLDQGLKRVEQLVATTKTNIISGKAVFELYDTYGFPEDLTALILKEKGYDYTKAEFAISLQKQKKRSKSASQVVLGDWITLSKELPQGFVGHQKLQTTSRLIKYRQVSPNQGQVFYQLIFDITPCYPEGGGQLGDQGLLRSADGSKIKILDTKKENDLIQHKVSELPNSINGTFEIHADAKRRKAIAANHTATHLLHQALRAVLGTHVAQKGSLVSEKGLRFDFSHFGKLTEQELQSVTEFVQSRIADNLALAEQVMPYSEALDAGAIALFGEKYGDMVRTIRFGDSMELCGGTHVPQTSAIWYFIIRSESSVAAGIRRIEAITGEIAKAALAKASNTLEAINKLLMVKNDPIKAIKTLQAEQLRLHKTVDSLLQDKVQAIKIDLKQKFRSISGVDFLAERIDVDAAAAKNLIFELGAERQNCMLLFATTNDQKAVLTCYIDKKLVADRNLNASKIVKELGKHIRGGGGGQAFFATAGGKHTAGIQNALDGVPLFLEKALK